MRTLLLLGALLMMPAAARAAAWTQPQDSWQVIASLIYSHADRSYDAQGHASWPKLFQRLLLQTDTEYGWNDDLTLFARTETAWAHVRDNTAPAVTATDNAVEAGARYRLLRPGLVDGDDVLSLEGSVRSAGAFNFAVSANANAAGRDAGFRLLYGASFPVAGRYGFVDIEAGERWVSRPRPDQTPIDITTGLWLDAQWMVMLQSFNLVSGPARAPYDYFRSHKLELSTVWHLSRLFSLQIGGFVSPAGQNALNEQGLCVALWSNF